MALTEFTELASSAENPPRDFPFKRGRAIIFQDTPSSDDGNRLFNADKQRLCKDYFTAVFFLLNFHINKTHTTMTNSIHVMILIILVFTQNLLAQEQRTVRDYLRKLPANLKLPANKTQRYAIITEYFNGDIYGNFMNKTRVTGEYVRGLPGDAVTWNKVFISNSNTRAGGYRDSTMQQYMENFSYVPASGITEKDLFTGFPPNSFFTKNLIWDMFAIEMFAWQYFDSLLLNRPFRPHKANGVVQLAGEGTFENRDIILKWIGISYIAEEICALIEFRTFDNPLTIATEGMSAKGRSHYWGTIWVSLTDKEIEHALLYEDVLMDLDVKGMPKQLINSTREIVFKRIN